MNQRLRPGVTNRTNVPPQTPPSRPEDTSIASSRVEECEADDMVMQVEGVYIISVAARILDMHPQTLRKYERLGLINPGRTLGMLRLYSREDIRKLRLIRHLSDEMGLNLAGVEFALATVENLLTLQKRLAVRLNDPAAEQAVEEELGMLLQSLNIPIEL